MSKGEIYQEYNGDEEVLNSPFSRLYFCPETEQIMNCAMILRYPIDVVTLKKAFSNSFMIKDPRFCSILVRTPNNGDHWKRTKVNIDDHFILHYPTTTKTNHLNLENDNDEAAVNVYLADIAVSTPLSKNKPLWEIHVLVELKCVVLRVHHALGDGVSLMSMLSSCFGQKRDITSGVNNDLHVVMKDHNTNNAKKRKWKVGGLWGLIKSLWFTLVFGLSVLWRVLGVKDKIGVLSGGDGIELWPRKLVTTKFKIEDFKSIKLGIPNVTVNDVLLGIISHGLSKYVHDKDKSSKVPQQSFQATSILAVNLRENLLQEKDSDFGVSLWGNKTGLLLLPLHCSNGLHPLDHVMKMKATMDQKKNSYEALVCHKFLKLVTTYLGPKAASWCCHQVLCNTTLLISNIMGPSEEIAIGDNPVMSIRVSISGQPQALTLHMVSYAGKADLQVMVAKDIIPDPEFLVKCFQDSLFEMKKSIKLNLGY